MTAIKHSKVPEPITTFISIPRFIVKPCFLPTFVLSKPTQPHQKTPVTTTFTPIPTTRVYNILCRLV